MKLRNGKSYRTRDGKDIVMVRSKNNGTNYNFQSNAGATYLDTGHTLSAKYETSKDLVELVE